MPQSSLTIWHKIPECGLVNVMGKKNLVSPWPCPACTLPDRPRIEGSIDSKPELSLGEASVLCAEVVPSRQAWVAIASTLQRAS